MGLKLEDDRGHPTRQTIFLTGEYAIFIVILILIDLLMLPKECVCGSTSCSENEFNRSKKSYSVIFCYFRLPLHAPLQQPNNILKFQFIFETKFQQSAATPTGRIRGKTTVI